MAYTTATIVKQYAQVAYADFLEGTFANDAAFVTFITDTVIPAAQSYIDYYCDQTWTTAPADVADVCARVAANILQYMIMNKQGPLVRVDQFKVVIPECEVLTPGLRMLLGPHIKRTLLKT